MWRLIIDEKAVWVAAISFTLFSLAKIFLFPSPSLPALYFSKKPPLRRNWRLKLAPLPLKGHLTALLFLTVAFLDPKIAMPLNAPFFPSPKESSEGVALYLVLDKSGSMAEKVSFRDEAGEEHKLSKMEILKTFTSRFIGEHSGDLIGMVAFARVPTLLVPLTLDQESLKQELQHIKVAENAEEDGTAMGYAIYKTARLLALTRQFASDTSSHLKPAYTIKSALMIVVTDGFQDPSRLDAGNRLRLMELDDAAAYAQKEGIKLYVINIDPALSSAAFAPQRKELERITALTGGAFYLTSSGRTLKSIYEKINQLEKGTIEHKVSQEVKEQLFSFSFFFLFLGMAALFFSLFLEYIFLRRVP